MQIAKDKVVSLDVRLSDVHSNLIQQSAEAVQYLHGDYGGIFPVVEEALQGKAPGEHIEVRLEPEDAFGEYDAELVQLAERAQFPPELEVGMQFEREGGPENELLIHTVTDIGGDQVVLDGNHPLAGMALDFVCTVVAVRDASAGEIERGYADDDAAGPLISVVQ
ncbi:MAG: peptidylprolyl isomerase [Betaproteobacteria bacterium RIFCSPLOWO2_12_FULL_62_13b]|nr:MAG: peptidylprolyl isomerase [Betaproteobacteria bacterium RIFCSPLOWO2_12_FULL_62_13b]